MNFDLLIFLFFYISSIISILGYGLIFQKIINIPKNDFCLGYSGLIGIFFLTIISYTSNIILPHGLIHNSIIFIIGFFMFIYFFFKNYILKKDIKVFALIFLFLFLSFLVFKAHDDFPYYHFPYTYYLTENSSYLGIGNFNHGFRTPSSLFYFNSLFYLPVINYNLFHIGSLVYFGFSIYLLVNKILNGLKNNQIDYLYYYNLLALIFIIVFFYRLAEHGTDRSALILVFIIISEILRILNKVKISNYDVSIISVLYALIISLKAFYFLYIIMLIPLIFLISSPAYCDVTSKLQTSVSIQVNAAGTQVERLGGSYSASGTNVGTTNTGDQLGGFSVNSTTNAVTFDAGQYSINSNATNWSLTESLLQPDTMQSGTLDVGSVNNFGNVTSTAAGVGTGFDVTIGSDHTITDLDAGGAGSVTTGQFVTEVTTK